MHLVITFLLLSAPAPPAAGPTFAPTQAQQAVQVPLDHRLAPFVTNGNNLLASAHLTRRQRDSLRNGIVAGAVVGGIAAAVFAAYLCNAVGEEGDPPCWRGTLAIGAIGAGIGAAAGAGIDAAFARTRKATVAVRVRF